MSLDPRTTMRRLYADHWGYDVTAEEDRRVVETEGSSTYGEIMPSALDQLIDVLDPDEDDRFFDLGSGLGKVVVQAAMTRTMAACVGIELVQGRHRAACQVLAQARAEGLLKTQDVRFRHGDLLRARLDGATIVYTCSTAFSDAFMAKVTRRLAGLPAGLRLATLLDLDENPWFRLEDVLRLDMSWRRRAKVHVYRLVTPRARR